MSNLTTYNAKIENTFLGFEDHGIFTAIISLEYQADGSNVYQSFGYRRLDGGRADAFITGVLHAAGVESWEELPGTLVRIKACNTGIEVIGHIIRDTEWFDGGG